MVIAIIGVLAGILNSPVGAVKNKSRSNEHSVQQPKLSGYVNAIQLFKREDGIPMPFVTTAQC